MSGAFSAAFSKAFDRGGTATLPKPPRGRLARLLTTPATIHTRTLHYRDEAGDEHYQDTDTDTMIHLAQKRRLEGSDGNPQTEEHLAFVAAGISLDGWTAITANGHRYEVIGPPWEVTNARTGQTDHIEATIRRTT